MRLRETHSVITLPNPPVEKPLEEIREILGGTIQNPPSFLQDKDLPRSKRGAIYVTDGTSSATYSPRTLLHASYHLSESGAIDALVSLPGLSNVQQAGRWLALGAYTAYHGIQMGSLRVEVPGTDAGREGKARSELSARESAERRLAAWKAQQQAALDQWYATASNPDDEAAFNAFMDNARSPVDLTQVDSSFIVRTDYSSATDPILSYFDNSVDAALQSGSLADPATHRRAQEGEANANRAVQGAIDNPNHDASTMLLIRQGTLHDLVHDLTQRYAELVFHTDTDPGATVARALGTTSLGHFDYVWDAAMAQESPVAAGKTVMTMLHIPKFA